MSSLREFLMLAHPADFAKHSVGGYYMSEKLDGMRCLWDSGITRGIACSDIPFANVEKHARFINEQVSTGLWSRYGQPIQAPDWFLNGLPKCILDGELYAGRGQFQFVVSTVKDHNPNSEDWKRINYHIFDLPPVGAVFGDGEIRNTNFKKKFSSVADWFERQKGYSDLKRILYGTMFETAYTLMQRLELPKDSHVIVHNQIQLPLSQDKAVEEINHWLDTITSNGGEGLMVRKRDSAWTPKRTNDLLKIKKLQDSEGVVIGYTTGERTTKGSKLLGLLGSLKISWQGKVFDLSGFTDEERTLGLSYGFTGHVPSDACAWATENPGKELPEYYNAVHFPRGSKVTFRYRETTDDGYPKEGRFWRKKVD